MTRNDSEPSVAATKRELDRATAALAEPGAGALANLECRVSDLQVRFLSIPSRDLADIEARLQSLREMVVAIGDAGYLLNVVDATLEDVRAMRVGNR